MIRRCLRTRLFACSFLASHCEHSIILQIESGEVCNCTINQNGRGRVFCSHKSTCECDIACRRMPKWLFMVTELHSLLRLPHLCWRHGETWPALEFGTQNMCSALLISYISLRLLSQMYHKYNACLKSPSFLLSWETC